MQHRDGMRPRTIDDNKSYQVIKDIEQAKKTASPEELKELEKFDIIIYVAFASAPFVRTSSLLYRKPKLEYKWQHLSV